MSERSPEILNRKELWPPSFDRAMNVLNGETPTDFTLCFSGEFSPSSIINSCIPSGVDAESLQLGEDSHPSWAVVDAAHQYLSYNTAEYLAALVASAEGNLGDDLLRFRLTERLPWPAAACLRSAQQNGNFTEIAEALRAGKMGDIEQWTRWEEGWKTSQLEWSSFCSSHDESLPFVADSWLAAPLMGVHAYIGGRQEAKDPWPTVLEVCEIAQGLKDPAGRAAMVSHLDFLVSWRPRTRHDEPADIPLSRGLLDAVKAVLRVQTDSSIAWMTQRWLARVDTSSSSDTDDVARYVALVNEAVELDEEFRVQRFDAASVALFRLAVAHEPSRVGLLVPIAACAADREHPFAPFDINTHLQRVPQPLGMREEAAVMLIRARQAPLPDSEFPRVVALVENFGEDYLSELIVAVGGAPNKIDIESLLVRLHNMLRRSRNELIRDAALSELANRLRRRQTDLAQGEEWERLGLPRELLSLCR